MDVICDLTLFQHGIKNSRKQISSQEYISEIQHLANSLFLFQNIYP